MTVLLIILGLGICAFLIRYLPLILWKEKELPGSIKVILGYIPPAILAGIVFPALFYPDVFNVKNNLYSPYLIGGLITLLATLISKNVLISSFIGIIVFFLIRWLIG